MVSLEIKTPNETIKHIKPARATVVNLGVSFLHLKLTEKIEKPVADVRPKINPAKVFFSWLPNAIITIPIVAIIIATQTLKEMLSFKNRNPNSAVMKGIAAKHNKVTAAVVFVMDHIKVIIAIASPDPPINPDKPILL